jgi:hypothetical protein
MTRQQGVKQPVSVGRYTRLEVAPNRHCRAARISYFPGLVRSFSCIAAMTVLRMTVSPRSSWWRR